MTGRRPLQRRCRRDVRAAALLVLMLALAGCAASTVSGRGTPGASTTSGATTSRPSSTSASTASSTPASSTPASSTSPAATTSNRATGLQVRTAVITLNLPLGWKAGPPNRVTINGFDPKGSVSGHGEGVLNAYDYTQLSIDTRRTHVRDALDEAKDPDVHPVRRADRVVGGVKGFVITNSARDRTTFYLFATEVSRHLVDISIEFSQKIRNPQAVIESVLATVHFS